MQFYNAILNINYNGVTNIKDFSVGVFSSLKLQILHNAALKHYRQQCIGSGKKKISEVTL